MVRDADHQAEGKNGIEQYLYDPMGPELDRCVHRIQTRVARSKGDCPIS